MSESDGLVDQQIRGAKHVHDVVLRRAWPGRRELRTVRKALRDINRLETLAVQLYRAQWSREPTELNRQLLAALENEITHHADSLGRLMEFGGRPTVLRLPYYVLGWLMGRASRIIGFRAMMRLGAWAENKAVEHYERLAEACRWHGPTHEMVVAIGEDEKVHRSRWRYLHDHPEIAHGPPQRIEDDLHRAARPE